MRNNDEFYLKEAFNELKLLNEESFELSNADKGVVDELQSFVADDIEMPYEEEVIDVEADTEDDLQDNYVGKVILQCKCCNTKIYKDAKDVFVDDESNSANVEEECPVCGNAFGWSVIGKIEPFDANADFEVKEEEPEEVVELEDEISDDEIGEALKEALSLDDVTVDSDIASDDTQKLEANDNDLITESEDFGDLDQNELNNAVYDALSNVALENMENGGKNTRKGFEIAEKNFNDSYFQLDDSDFDESLTEDLDEVSVKANDQEVTVSVDDSNKVSIDIAPKEETPVEIDDTMIAPLSDEEEAEIEANVPDDGSEDEFEVDEFDEETFDELGESFLKRVYENVDSFKTSQVKYSKNKLTVEGLINFNSGKSKKTSFVFENFKNTKRGKVLVSGLNETFSNSKRAFILKGSLINRKLTCESLTYNYNTKSINESNNAETIKVYGRAVIKKK